MSVLTVPNNLEQIPEYHAQALGDILSRRAVLMGSLGDEYGIAPNTFARPAGTLTPHLLEILIDGANAVNEQLAQSHEAVFDLATPRLREVLKSLEDKMTRPFRSTVIESPEATGLEPVEYTALKVANDTYVWEDILEMRVYAEQFAEGRIKRLGSKAGKPGLRAANDALLFDSVLSKRIASYSPFTTGAVNSYASESAQPYMLEALSDLAAQDPRRPRLSLR